VVEFIADSSALLVGCGERGMRHVCYQYLSPSLLRVLRSDRMRGGIETACVVEVGTGLPGGSSSFWTKFVRNASDNSDVSAPWSDHSSLDGQKGDFEMVCSCATQHARSNVTL
jgi:hypothetical protein